MKKDRLYIVQFKERINNPVGFHDYFYCFGSLMANFRGHELTVLSINDTRIDSFREITEKDLKDINDIVEYIERLKLAFNNSSYNKKRIFYETLEKL